MTTHTAQLRSVIEGESPSSHDTVSSAQRLLHGGAAALSPLAADLAAGLQGGVNDVKVERYVRLLYATDASIYEMEPIAVVFPRSTADVQHVMRVAAKHHVPVLPRGGGTSLSGQTVNHAIVVDFTTHLDAILEINAEERWARVEPGVVLSELNKALRPQGLMYPIDPSTANRATIGGGIGNNSCGAHSAIYGKTIDNVVSMEVVLADGTTASFDERSGTDLDDRLAAEGLEGAAYRETRRLADTYRAEVEARFPKILRRVSGYNLNEFAADGPMNLARLIVGSEGTLATVTEAKVRVVPIPTMKGLAAVHFGSVVEAAKATVVANRHAPSAVELIDATIVNRCRASIGYRDLVTFIEGDPGALLFVEFYGETETELEAKLAALREDLLANDLSYATVATTDPAEQLQRWRVRESGLGLLMSVRGDAKPVAFVEDTAVAPERLPEYVARFDAAVKAHGLEAGYYGHASVGCLHIRPIVNLKDGQGLDEVEALAGEIADLVLEFGGSLSGEHGDGIVRGAFTERMFGPVLTQAFRDLKHVFDPSGLLNPGKIVDTPPFRENLRLSPATQNHDVKTHLNFAAEGGLALAAEQCNGQGACRKPDGAMCPSFMVTAEEEHSTRGRANLLRQALNGALPSNDLSSQRMFDAFDLCVECKACKSECPSGVDVAKIKYELLTQYYERHGTPLRARAFARINQLSQIGSRVPLIANTLGRIGPLRALLERVAGIDQRRPLPRLARRSFRRWWKSRALSQASAPRGEAILFADTFTDFYQPGTGRAAVKVLEALGYRVRVVEKLGCCGRPAISKGQLPLASQWAKANIERLRSHAEQGTPIVGIEPSCLLTLRDEYPDLVPGEAAQLVAKHAVLIDELVARLGAAEPGVAQLFRDDVPKQILLHTHCHQKALVGSDATLQALRLVPGYEVALVDSGCCGMAGSFGFEAEHYETSRAMGEHRLFPAVRGADRETVIAVTGVSCRQQIDHFTGRRARSVVELLAEALPS
jgi:FAD/FMN-containing dehydrogenase/Fe-S oxidoreductase